MIYFLIELIYVKFAWILQTILLSYVLQILYIESFILFKIATFKECLLDLSLLVTSLEQVNVGERVVKIEFECILLDKLANSFIQRRIIYTRYVRS